jgi:hypothetical protein
MVRQDMFGKRFSISKSTAPQQAAGFAMVVAIGELSQQAAGNIPRRDLKFQILDFKSEIKMF